MIALNKIPNQKQRFKKRICASVLISLFSLLIIFAITIPFYNNYKRIKTIESWVGKSFDGGIYTEPRGILKSLSPDSIEWLQKNFSDEILLPFMGVTMLRYCGGSISDLEIRSLIETEIRDLDLVDTQITSSGFKMINEITTLKALCISKSNINDQQLIYLKGLNNLEHLDLSNTSITDQSMRTISGMKKIAYLVLESTRITDQGILHLNRLKSLRTLIVSDTNVTMEGVQKLEVLLPECRVLGIIE